MSNNKYEPRNNTSFDRQTNNRSNDVKRPPYRNKYSRNDKDDLE